MGLASDSSDDGEVRASSPAKRKRPLGRISPKRTSLSWDEAIGDTFNVMSSAFSHPKDAFVIHPAPRERLPDGLPQAKPTSPQDIKYKFPKVKTAAETKGNDENDDTDSSSLSYDDE